NLVLVRCSQSTTTWIYKPATNTWTGINPPVTPSVRLEFNMEYDATHKRVILFGGYQSSTAFNDTWAYDMTANTWTNMNPSNPPSARLGMGMAFNSKYGVVVLWGGKSVT